MIKSIWGWLTGKDFLNEPRQSEQVKNDILQQATGHMTMGVELEAKASNPKPAKKKYTKASLSKLTKADLEQVGRSDFGIELDRRKKKDDLVAELLKAQKG
jgi:hypothetical protein